jgi:hydroxymethylglutaryl-CoA lyase
MQIPSDPVEIVEVGPRDGLQNLKTIVPTKDKVSLIRQLSQSGIKQIQIGGFVSPQAIPQFHDIRLVAKEVVSTISGIKFSALTPNLKGVENALQCGIKKICFVFSVSQAHNRNNVGKTPEESLIELEKVVRLLKHTPEIEINVDLATAFGCPYTLQVPMETVIHYVKKVWGYGIRQITLCDTVGYGNPLQVLKLISTCCKQFPGCVFRCHFHNTRGLGLANCLAAYMAGIRSFDSSIGGLGGCPYAPGATGNISTEDLVFMFNEMGVKTGINLERLFASTSYLTQILPDIVVNSHLFRAKPPCAQHNF